MSHHWLNTSALRLIWLRQKVLYDILYLGSQFSKARSRSHFSSFWINSWVMNRPLYLASTEGCFHAKLHRWTSAASKNVSHVLTVSFFSLKIHIPYTLQMQLHSTTCLDWLDTPSRCGHKALCAICKSPVRVHSLPILSADIVRGAEMALSKSILFFSDATAQRGPGPLHS